ncbi:hypothetical protein Btru_058664 [Bulinus truncatus]|nr:hypothetical protein Btru_058664 [Bulinus truncatus]
MGFLVYCIACVILIAKISESLPVVEQGLRCDQPADIIFLVDTSSSIWPEDFNKHVKKFLKDIIASFNIGPGPLDTRVGVLLFGTAEYLQFYLNRYKTVNETLRAVEAIRYRGGDTYTHRALEYAAKWMLSPGNGARPDVAKIVIVLTDGKSTDNKKTIAAAKQVKEKGADIFSVGVGNGVDFKELQEMASSPSEQFVFQVNDFRTLDSIKNRFKITTCEVLSTTLSTQSTTTPTTTTTTEPTTTTTTTTTEPTTTTTTTTTTTKPTTTTTTPTTTTTTPTTTTTTPTTTTTKPTTTTTTTTNEVIPLDEACGGKPADIYFLLDSSSSVWIVHFQDLVLPFVRDLVNSFHISPMHTRIGLVTFSDRINPEFNLSAFTDRKALLQNLQPEHVEYLTGQTNTGDAIKYVSDIGFGPDHAREGVAQIIITVTDGLSQDPEYTAHAAAEAKKKGVIMFAIGVGQDVDDKELTDISSDPDDDYKFHVDNFAALSSVKDIITNKTCAAIGDQPETFHQCSGISSNIMFVYEYLNSVSSSKYILDDLIVRFTENAGHISPGVNIGTLTQPCIGEGVELSGILRFQEALTAVRQGYSVGYPGLLMKLRLSVFDKVPKESRKVAVLVVDSMTRNWDSLRTEVNKLKDMNVEIFLVVVGDVKQEALENLASAPAADHIMKVNQYSYLKHANLNVLNMVCGLNFEKELSKRTHVNTNSKTEISGETMDENTTQEQTTLEYDEIYIQPNK